jgi:hypothetical protein
MPLGENVFSSTPLNRGTVNLNGLQASTAADDHTASSISTGNLATSPVPGTVSLLHQSQQLLRLTVLAMEWLQAPTVPRCAPFNACPTSKVQRENLVVVEQRQR